MTHEWGGWEALLFLFVRSVNDRTWTGMDGPRMGMDGPRMGMDGPRMGLDGPRMGLDGPWMG
jgi:hypothetical protein